jgi:uncharacterized protein with ParB-like and HNH nuclease domain
VEANTYSLKQIFNQERRFIVPTFQRDYEWTLEEQWELLFSDLEDVADRLHDTRLRAEAAGEQPAKADKRVAPHFLGAVVLDQLAAPAGGIDLRAVIDGQQRLTTLQLLIRSVLDVLIEQSSPRVKQVRRLLLNPSDVVSHEYERYKLWPRRRDRVVWPEAMNEPPVTNGGHGYLAARDYFVGRTRAAVSGTDGEDRTDAVVDALLDLFKLVVIDLEDNDDAQVIFEVLNGRQTPLSAADLVKNFLFLRGEMADEKELEAVYDRYWAPFDDAWWKETVGRGHATRGRRDVLLSSWLTAVSATETNIGHLYSEVRRYLDKVDRKTPDVLAELHDYGKAYRVIYAGIDGSSPRQREVYHRLDLLGIVTALPVLLWLRTLPAEHLSDQEHDVAVTAVESWVVRRLITGANTRGYGKAFLDVLKSAKSAAATSGASIAAAVVGALDNVPGSLAWPDDAAVEDAFVNRKMYDVLTQERIRMLLGAIDERSRYGNPKTEPARFDYDVLQIEHVMPRSWRGEWSIGSTGTAERALAAQQRDQIVHRIGNLTLVTSTFNRSISNSAWRFKREALVAESKLQINADFGAIETWDELAIEARARSLAAVANSVWPSPRVLLHQVGV